MRSPLLFFHQLRTGKLDKVDFSMESQLAAVELEKKITEKQFRAAVAQAQQGSEAVRVLKVRQQVPRTKQVSVTVTNEGLVLWKDHLLIPPCFVIEALDSIHEHGESVFVCIKKLHQWGCTIRGVVAAVTDYIASCEKCSRAVNYGRRKIRDRTIANPKVVNMLMHADVMTFGHKKVLVSVDAFSKFIRFVIMDNETGRSVRDALLSLFLEWSPPQALKTDNGSPFKAAITEEMVQVFNVHHTFICPQNSRGNGVSAQRQFVDFFMRKPSSYRLKIYSNSIVRSV